MLKIQALTINTTTSIPKPLTRVNINEVKISQFLWTIMTISSSRQCSIINGHLFGQHLRLRLGLRLTPLGQILFVVFWTINLIDNLSSIPSLNIYALVCLRNFDSFNACSCHMHNSISFHFISSFSGLSLRYVNFDKWSKHIFYQKRRVMSVFCVLNNLS